ncbi:MAG: LLM class flavin-dependent oxidoreductase [Pseudomonadota bacterium]
MKVGALQFFGWPNREKPIADIYTRAMQRIDLMESAGFDAVWLAEHHFTGYSVCPSVHMMGVHIAARTERLRIGTGVSLPSLSHPLRVAEEVALLDVLSDGRVNWGAGRGFDPREHQVFGVESQDSKPKFHEFFQAVVESWGEGPVSFAGDYVSYDSVEVLPRSVQQPHPPVWIGASSLEALLWAAERGYSVLMDPHSTHQEIADKRREYENTLRDNGFAIEGRDIPISRQIAIGSTDKEGREIARRACEWLLGVYDESMPVSGNRRATLHGQTVDEYIDGCVLWGTPARVIDQIERLKEEASMDHLMIAPLSEKSFQLFVNQLVPRI